MRRHTVLYSLLLLGVAAFVACGNGDLLQGDDYRPNGELATAPPSERIEGATSCDAGEGGPADGAACDAGAADVKQLPIGDASTAPTNTCETARAIGTISGDVGATKVNAQGACSEWISVRATEDSSSALGVAMKAKLTLTPAAGDFDLFVFYDPVRDVRACTAPFASSFASGTTVETASLSWGEGSVANGSDDGRTIGVAIIKMGGPCGPDAGSWTLLAEGNR
jgi:hypothetical protein